MSEKIDQIKVSMEKSKGQQKVNEEKMKEFLESDEGRKTIAFGQREIVKVLVPIVVIIIALQLLTGANDAWKWTINIILNKKCLKDFRFNLQLWYYVIILDDLFN